MGLFDFLKKSKKGQGAEPVTEAPNRFIDKTTSISEEKQALYDDFKKELDEIQQLCKDNNLDFDEIARNHRLIGDWIPKNLAEYDYIFSTNFEFVIETFPKLVSDIKKEVERAKTPVEPTPTPEPKKVTPTPPKSNSVMQNQLSRTKIISDSEIGREVDEYYDKALKAYNDPRLNTYASEALSKYKAMEAQTKKEEAMKNVLQKLKDDPKFLENCRNYPRPYSFIYAVVTEMDRIYSKTKHESYNPTAPLYETFLEIECKKDEITRNTNFFKLLVGPLKNNRQKNDLHYGNFLNKYANFIGKEYQLGDDPLEVGKKYYKVYKEYVEYEKKTKKLNYRGEKYGIRPLEIAQEHGVQIATTFEKYYNSENKEELNAALDIITPIFYKALEGKRIESIIERLSDNPEFIKNCEIYGNQAEFVKHIIDQLTTIYEATQNSKFDPNSNNYVSVYCTLPEAERNVLFEQALDKEKNKGPKK